MYYMYGSIVHITTQVLRIVMWVEQFLAKTNLSHFGQCRFRSFCISVMFNFDVYTIMVINLNF